VLGASLAQGESTKALLGIFIFIGYILGAALAYFLLRAERHNTLGLSTKAIYTLGIEMVLLLALFLVFMLIMIIPHLTLVLCPCSLLLLSRWEFSLSVQNMSIEVVLPPL
jgi:uncharacterized membrane protein YoaK (UPF0700 family)